MAIDQFGNAHVTWRGLDGFVYYALVNSNHNVVIPATAVYNTIPISSPRIAVDSAGNAHIITTPGGAYDLIYLKVSNGVRTLLKAFSLNNPPFSNEEYDTPCISIDPVSQLPVIASECHFEVTSPSIRYLNSISSVFLDSQGNPNRITRWNAYALNNTSSPQYNAQLPALVVDALGRRHCVWQDKESTWSGYSIGYANDFTSSWTEIAQARNEADLAGRPRMVQGNNSDFDIVWATTSKAIVWHELNQGGSTVVADTIVSQPAAQASSPQVAAGFGSIQFGWTDTRTPPNAQIFVNPNAYAPSDANVVGSTGATFNHALGLRSNNSMVLVWQDNSSGSNQIFYRAQQLSITPLRLLTSQTQASLTDDIDAPIAPVVIPNVLATANTPLGAGVVADGVTPVLLKIAGPPGDYSIQVTNSSSSFVGNMATNLLVLRQGTWQVSSTITFLTNSSTASGTAFAYLQGLDWTQFAGSPPYQEISNTITVTSIATPSLSASITFGVRPPPIALVHGIHDDGTTWSQTFTNTLGQYRPADFFVPVTYGRGFGTNTLPNTLAWPCTTKPFEYLAPMLDGVLQQQLEAVLKTKWAFTRYDIVGHSQGGVLARMLCQNAPGSSQGRFVTNCIVSADNFYRGRFRRVITIGSPHNGSLLTWYLDEMRVSDEAGFGQFDDAWFGILSLLSPDKFNPFWPQIQEINNQAFPVDSRIKFNCIRCAIASGAPPSLISTQNPPEYNLLGLEFPARLPDESRGQVLLPDGSDGAVDWDSEGGGVGTPSTIISIPSISHSWPELIFGVQPGQTETASPSVAATVAQLLDGPANRFGAFQLPTLHTSVDLQNYENALPPETVVRNLIEFLPKPNIPTTNLNLALQIPSDLPLAGQVSWNVEVFGTNGVDTNGVSLVVDTNDSTQVSVSIVSLTDGTAVLYASYVATNGDLVFATPFVVASDTGGATLNGIQINPTTASMAIGDRLQTAIWGSYSNGVSILLYIPLGQAQYSSSRTNVAMVDSNGMVTMISPGTATIMATYQGFSAQSTIASVAQSVGTISAAIVSNGTVQLSFVGSLGASNTVEASTNLTTWVPLATVVNTNGFIQYQDGSATNFPSRFYRIVIP